MSIKSTIIAIVVIVAVGSGGYYFGQKSGEERGALEKQTLKSLVDSAFPRPASVIHTLTGKITGIYGATINLEIDNPDDYLPHLDNSPRQKQTRFANVTAKTTYKLVDFGKFDKQGNPEVTAIKITDLKNGDTVNVQSDENIRDTQKFDVTTVELVKY